MLMFWVQISQTYTIKVMTPSPSFDDEFHELCCMNFDLAYLDNASGILLFE
jgi:penicillin V acylase-like amidase (Ntn superfamily)